VELESFTASVQGNSVVLKWKTASEIENVGFRIYRMQQGVNAESLRILNAQLIPAQGTEFAGANYEHVDGSVRGTGTFYYFLEDTDVHGAATLHGPVRVSFGPSPRPGASRQR
jgi:hypothetical protein